MIDIKMGIGDWGLGIEDWGVGVIDNFESSIHNPQTQSTFQIITKKINNF